MIGGNTASEELTLPGGISALTVQAAAWVGRHLKRREDPRFLRGQGRYVDDVVLPGMVHLVAVRSTIGHAHLRKIETSTTLGTPGVVAVVTAHDLPERMRFMPQRAPIEGAQIARAPHPL